MHWYRKYCQTMSISLQWRNIKFHFNSSELWYNGLTSSRPVVLSLMSSGRRMNMLSSFLIYGSSMILSFIVSMQSILNISFKNIICTGLVLVCQIYINKEISTKYLHYHQGWLVRFTSLYHDIWFTSLYHATALWHWDCRELLGIRSQRSLRGGFPLVPFPTLAEREISFQCLKTCLVTKQRFSRGVKKFPWVSRNSLLFHFLFITTEFQGNINEGTQILKGKVKTKLSSQRKWCSAIDFDSYIALYILSGNVAKICSHLCHPVSVTVCSLKLPSFLVPSSHSLKAKHTFQTLT